MDILIGILNLVGLSKDLFVFFLSIDLFDSMHIVYS